MKIFSFLKRKSRLSFSMPTYLEVLTNTALVLYNMTLREPFSSRSDHLELLKSAFNSLQKLLIIYKRDLSCNSDFKVE